MKISKNFKKIESFIDKIKDNYLDGYMDGPSKKYINQYFDSKNTYKIYETYNKYKEDKYEDLPEEDVWDAYPSKWKEIMEERAEREAALEELRRQASEKAAEIEKKKAEEEAKRKVEEERLRKVEEERKRKEQEEFEKEKALMPEGIRLIRKQD